MPKHILDLLYLLYLLYWPANGKLLALKKRSAGLRLKAEGWRLKADGSMAEWMLAEAEAES